LKKNYSAITRVKGTWVPRAGLPLPFISAGSTSIMIFMSMLGVVQNVYRQSRKSKI